MAFADLLGGIGDELKGASYADVQAAQQKRDQQSQASDVFQQLLASQPQTGPLTPQQQYQSHLLSLAAASPDLFGQQASKAMDPLEELDAQLKRAQTANAQAQANRKDLLTLPTGQILAYDHDTNTAKPVYTPKVLKAGDNLYTLDENGNPVQVGKQGGGGPFSGNSMEAQLENILLTGDPSSPEYARAYALANKPRTVVDPTTGAVTNIQPDVSTLRKPTFAVGSSQPGQPAISFQPGTRFNNEQSLAAGFSDRMKQAEGDLNGSIDALADPTQTSIASFPLVGNYLASTDYQKASQARRNFVNAQLRRESGAAIAQSEFDSANKQYFPVPGDSAEVKAQKAQNRALAIEAMGRSAGPSYQGAAQTSTSQNNFPPVAAAGKALRSKSTGKIIAVSDGTKWVQQ